MFNAVNKSLSGSLVSAFNGIAFLSPTKNHHSSPYPLPASSSSTLCESSKYLKEIHCSVTKVSFTCTQTGLTQSKCPTQWEVLKFGYVKKESTKVLSCLNFLVEGRKQLCRSPPPALECCRRASVWEALALWQDRVSTHSAWSANFFVILQSGDSPTLH